ncbi:MAG: aminotransferase class I/II-fold pyridoxal phosphate-dependent enzyme [Eggerthellaceae bacterium]|nr:aminotransferase class I/II-fold pyridoxal phosphate-dependent enzyme [Eggerthellaceae bacterium]
MTSSFLNSRYTGMTPYVPGEQPTDRAYVKLNSNETSLPPSPAVRAAINDALIDGLGRYADPHCMPLRRAIADHFGLDPACVFAGNGSDEVLGLLFLAFLGSDAPACFPDITYGFYRDYCGTFGVPYREIPLRGDFTLDVDAFAQASEHVIIANPNAPTGLRIPTAEVECIAQANPSRLVIVDEAYVDYGSESCIPLVENNPNLIVVHTMSKSRNLAGAHIGYAIAAPDIVSDLNDVKFSFNPFNLSAPTMTIGIAALSDEEHFHACTQAIIHERKRTIDALEQRGFTVLHSHANFVFACHPTLNGATWNAELRKRGVLCRHYAMPRIERWLRITVGTRQEMDAFLKATDDILHARA